MTSRRQFLWGTGGLFALGALTKTTGVLAAQPARNLILIVADGGWDVTYCMDPKLGLDTIDGPDFDSNLSNPNDKESLLSFGRGHIALNTFRRPAVENFFNLWGSYTAVINGIDIGSVAHPACKIRVMTGSQSETSPDVATMTGHAHGTQYPIGCMDLSGLGFAGPYAATTGRVGRSNQLKLLLDRNLSYQGDPNLGVNYPQFLSNSAERTAMEHFRLKRDARFFEERLKAGPRQRVQYEESLDRRARLMQDAALFNDNLAFKSQAVLGEQIELIVDLMSTGLAATVVVDSGPGWDTHNGNIAQHGNYQNLFTNLDRLLKALKRESLLNDTVVAVVSEMSRTPKRNANEGKDHWPTTSALVIGSHIAGGTAYGGTDHLLNAGLVDYRSGAVSSGGNPIRYDNFCAGLLQAVGVDSEDDLYLPGVVPFKSYLS